MKTTTTILPGVKAIGWVNCEKLPLRVDLHGICRTKVPVLAPINYINFYDEPVCQCKTVKEGGSIYDTASLKFACGALLPIHMHLGFVVTDTNDNSWLIGAMEPPFPKLNVDYSLGETDGDAAGFQYEVTHIAVKSLVPCLT